MRILILIFLFFAHFGHAQQQQQPTAYYRSPLEIPIILSGTFGELRSNHFHSGLDIKTGGETGANVFAIADGYVKRIKISHFGYGKAIYIQHPNGQVSVYAHLKNFNPKIESYIRKHQYAKESYQIESYPEAKALPVTKGQVIAYSGNTGGSGGPHLHFEIRDKHSRPMNPLDFGLDVVDTKKPTINSLWVYPQQQDDTAHANQQKEKQKLRLILQKDGTYKSSTLEACGQLGFGIATVDRLNMAPNKNGIYEITTAINGNRNFELQMNSFSFSESRYINRHIDYSYYKNYKRRIRKLFVETNDPLSIYNNVIDNGLLNIEDGMTYTYTITVKDHHGNTSLIRVPILGKASDSIRTSDVIKTKHFAKPTASYTHNEGRFDIHIPKNALYSPTYLDIRTSGDTIVLHKKDIPLHKKITLSMDVSHYNEKDKATLYLASLNKNNKPSYSSTSKKANRFSTRTRSFGKYTLAQDSIPPTVTPVDFKDKQWISNHRYLTLKIKDKGSGIDSFKATINGQFILMEYDYKTNKIFYDFNDNIIQASENKFKIIVLDNVGNTTTFEATFFRKNK